jgi:hypothetical protein
MIDKCQIKGWEPPVFPVMEVSFCLGGESRTSRSVGALFQAVPTQAD